MLVGIYGRARSGKNTFAEMLAEELFDRTGKKYVMMAYGDELKNRLQRDFDLSYDQLWGDKKEVEDERYPYPAKINWGSGFKCGSLEGKPMRFWTPREMMQFYGTECMRSLDDSFWTKVLFRNIKEKNYENVIVTDVRFPNEADPIKEHGGYVLGIMREDKPDVHGETHSSETSMDNYSGYDMCVNNDDTLDDLRMTAKQSVDFLITMENMKREK